MTVLYISPPGLWLKPFKFTKSKSTEYLFSGTFWVWEHKSANISFEQCRLWK